MFSIIKLQVKDIYIANKFVNLTQFAKNNTVGPFFHTHTTFICSTTVIYDNFEMGA